ncbi:HTTM domain-containing protein [Flavobacterium agricola]|uniref:HTTM domain-containing protein n=1 Tax=Flavobacterium agricola TaxID=2870839 RepID=A0ABY6M235_9FLAO|nr:HTTM domain-containing protein [Flavobacterium agricola]UYW01176.1 HTTM domain-containing protein [Flavobacterium agricola]
MNKLFQAIDNAPLIIFRIFFGVLFACESFGAILTGWVKDNFITPQFTFSHIGFDWLQPLPGYGMYGYFVVMGVFSVCVALGYRYRFSIIALTLLWAGVYLMQKTSYNNHYYLLLLISFVLVFLPANRYKALDVKLGYVKQQLTMPKWCSWIFILQIAIVYFYATIAKFYPDWLDGTFTKNLLANRTPFESVNNLFAQKWFYMFIAYAGIVFDGLIVPALLYKRTRTWAVIASLVFHIFNSIVLQIGIFPYFALSFAVFFYPPETIRKLFFKSKPQITETNNYLYKDKKLLLFLFLPFFILQLVLPIRHWFIPGDVLFTEEGHRLSWRMMLRSRSGSTYYSVIDKNTNERIAYDLYEKLTQKQHGVFSSHPDMIWQMAQRIKKEFAQQGIDVAVYAHSYVSINGRAPVQLINDKVDLAQEKWNYFGPSSFIFPQPEYFK